MDNKRNLGQYFTKTNPFSHPAFQDWAKEAKLEKKTVLEPFAGANDIIVLLKNIGYNFKYVSYDIEPKSPDVRQLNTLSNYPSGFSVVVTNPPYLAKNSAKRRKLFYPNDEYDDLYKYALSVVLKNTEFVAAIIPDSFITAGLFRERLSSVISLNMEMFEDTEHPVCLALFVSENKDRDPIVWVGDKKIGGLNEIEKLLPVPKERFKWKFNDPHGVIGLYALDSNKGPSIRFMDGNLIDPSSIKVSTRAITRIHLDNIKDAAKLIEISNRILSDIRSSTMDIFLTSFKGLREDGFYRKRLDFKIARRILDIAQYEVKNDE